LVDVAIPIHTHGDPVGLREGGVLIENLHQVDIRCPAGQIPESLGLNVTDLHMGGHMNASELELPDGVELITPPDTTVAHIEEPRSEAAAEPGDEEQATAEPEVISKGGEKPEGED
jgi:large subunit ribosomal protein L25